MRLDRDHANLASRQAVLAQAEKENFSVLLTEGLGAEVQEAVIHVVVIVDCRDERRLALLFEQRGMWIDSHQLRQQNTAVLDDRVVAEWPQVFPVGAHQVQVRQIAVP